jgi:hypothetical protein
MSAERRAEQQENAKWKFHGFVAASMTAIRKDGSKK